MSEISILRLHQQLCRLQDGALVYREIVGLVDGGRQSTGTAETPVSDVAAGFAFMDGRRAELFPEVAT